MKTIGILAYGSLIEEPGWEIENATDYRIDNVDTPFSVEFARKSRTRDGAPTLIPVTNGGAAVKAVLIVMKGSVSVEEAMDILYRREIRKIGEKRFIYKPPMSASGNNVCVEQLSGFSGIDVVLYTSIGANITDLTAANLAELAMNSAKSEAGKNGKDGISYLISVKKNGIQTPMLPAYESEILCQTNSETLEEAREKCLIASRSSKKEQG